MIIILLTFLSYIKLLDINPYGINKNPYADLPRDFLLYRAAYPIRYENKTTDKEENRKI